MEILRYVSFDAPLGKTVAETFEKKGTQTIMTTRGEKGSSLFYFFVDHRHSPIKGNVSFFRLPFSVPFFRLMGSRRATVNINATFIQLLARRV